MTISSSSREGCRQIATGEVDPILNVYIIINIRMFGSPDDQWDRMPDQVRHNAEHIHLKQLSKGFNSVLDIKIVDY